MNLTWVGTPVRLGNDRDARRRPDVLEYGDTRWELGAVGRGTRLTLWHSIDRRFISMGAAGWHIAFDVLDRLLGGTPIGRITGGRRSPIRRLAPAFGPGSLCCRAGDRSEISIQGEDLGCAVHLRQSNQTRVRQ